MGMMGEWDEQMKRSRQVFSPLRIKTTFLFARFPAEKKAKRARAMQAILSSSYHKRQFHVAPLSGHDLPSAVFV